VSGSSVDPASGLAIPHAWNLVWLDADTCVWTDVTWDDQGDVIYHAYFQTSLEEMSADHDIDTDIFTVPACTHDAQSYFDIHNATLTDESTPAEAAALFGAVENGSRTATFRFEGEDFSAWLSENLTALYRALGGNTGSFSRAYSRMGNEIRLTLTGGFAPAFYQISFSTPPAHVSVVGSTAQQVAAGDELAPVILTADEGYYFPANLTGVEQNGIRITRVDPKTLRIAGRPTADSVIPIPAPSVQSVQAIPTADFIATGADRGILSGVRAGMEYSTDGITWHPITSDAPLTLTGLSPCTLSIIMRGDGESTLDSPVQEIVITLPYTEDESTADGEDLGDETTESATTDESTTANGSSSGVTDSEDVSADTDKMTGGANGTVGLMLGCASALPSSMLSLLALLGAAMCTAKRQRK
jgi:hypothetical protein